MVWARGKGNSVLDSTWQEGGQESVLHFGCFTEFNAAFLTPHVGRICCSEGRKATKGRDFLHLHVSLPITFGVTKPDLWWRKRNDPNTANHVSNVGLPCVHRYSDDPLQDSFALSGDGEHGKIVGRLQDNAIFANGWIVPSIEAEELWRFERWFWSFKLWQLSSHWLLAFRKNRNSDCTGKVVDARQSLWRGLTAYPQQ